MEWLLAYVGLGAVAGFMAGLLGIGGGVIVVPALAYLFHLQGFDEQVIMHYAVATSLTTIIFTSLSSVRAHHRRRAILWPVFRRITPGLMVGAVAGALLADQLSSQVLAVVLGVAEIVIALQILTQFTLGSCDQVPAVARLTFAGVIIGGLATLVGVGGGILIVPFLLWCRTAVQNAVATSSACSVPIALLGAITFVIAGLDDEAVDGAALGYIHLPALAGITAASILTAPLGAHLTHRLPVAWLRRVFAIFLAVIGIRLLTLSL